MCTQVYAIGPGGQEKFVDVSDSEEEMGEMTVQNLREKLLPEFKLSTGDDIRMIFRAEPLTGSSKLSSYGIKHEDIIHLALKVSGG